LDVALGEITNVKVNGEDYVKGMKVKSNNFRITGDIAGANSVFVNTYKLSRFNPGDANWSYGVAESFGNLVPGKNLYKVYGTDSAGNKTPEFVVEITFEKTPVVVENTSEDLAP